MWDAINCCQLGLQIAQEHHVPHAEVVYQNTLGLCLMEHGDTRQSMEYLERGLALARKVNDRWEEGSSLTGLGIR
jgi:Tfp pilus assembly protein PilF